MNYNGQTTIVKVLKNKDLVALGQAIESLNKEVVDIKFAVAPETDYNLEYSAIIITKTE
jgi:hypothetical protein